MKNIKTFALLIAAAAISFSACNKENPEDNKGNEGGNNNGGNTEVTVCPDCGKNPCVCEEGDSYVAPIAIDGQFADWDALDATKVASASCDSDANYTALSKVKVYSDESYIYVYFEFVEDELVNTDEVPFHVYLDADNSAETGGYGNQWSEAVSEWNLEGFVMSGGSFCSYDPGLYLWEGGVGEDGWLWSESSILPEGSGIGAGNGSGNKYEFALNKELLSDMDVVFADTFGIGFDIQQEWESVGILPNAAFTDDNPKGLAPLLRVNVVK